jgi:Zn-finger nucleic acid-binding protein
MTLRAGQDYFTCEYCGNIAVPEVNGDGVRVLDEAANEQCPDCAVALLHAATDGDRILYCRGCGGMLVDMDVFAALVQDLRSRRDGATERFVPPDAAALRRRVRCPRCAQEMDTHVYEAGGNVVISDCERCQLDWIPHGGLDRIVRAPDYTYGAKT